MKQNQTIYLKCCHEEKAVHHLDHFIKSDLLTTNPIKDDDKETTNEEEKLRDDEK